MAAIHHSRTALRVMGDNLLPEEITTLLGRAPDRFFAKGDVEIMRSGKEIVRKFGLWSLKAEESEPGDLDAQVAALLGQLTQDLAVWRDLAARFDLDLFCGLFMDETNEGSDLSPATLLALGERGIAIGLDIYAPTRDSVTGPEALQSSGDAGEWAQDFCIVAGGFCRWCEQAPIAPDDAGRVREAALQIGGLYAAALRLPTLEEIEALPLPDAPAPPGRDGAMTADLASRFARFPVNSYRVFFDPNDLQDNEPTMPDLQDDLLDIHGDVYDGLQLYKHAPLAALWHWRMMFDAHWGRHAAGALHALAGYRGGD